LGLATFYNIASSVICYVETCQVLFIKQPGLCKNDNHVQSAIRSYRYFPADHFTETLGWTKLCDGVNHQITTDLTPS
jgi:hypothetical protein